MDWSPVNILDGAKVHSSCTYSMSQRPEQERLWLSIQNASDHPLGLNAGVLDRAWTGQMSIMIPIH